jgi:hypothetical protein
MAVTTGQGRQPKPAMSLVTWRTMAWYASTCRTSCAATPQWTEAITSTSPPTTTTEIALLVSAAAVDVVPESVDAWPPQPLPQSGPGQSPPRCPAPERRQRSVAPHRLSRTRGRPVPPHNEWRDPSSCHLCRTRIAPSTGAGHGNCTRCGRERDPPSGTPSRRRTSPVKTNYGFSSCATNTKQQMIYTRISPVPNGGRSSFFQGEAAASSGPRRRLPYFSAIFCR